MTFLIFLIIGITLLVYSIARSSSNSELKETGIQTTGVIFETAYETMVYPDERDHGSRLENKITVRFTTKEKEWITADIRQDFVLYSRGQYKPGDKITIYYNKDNPRRFYVETGQSELRARLLFAFVGLVFTIIGIYQFMDSPL